MKVIYSIKIDGVERATRTEDVPTDIHTEERETDAAVQDVADMFKLDLGGAVAEERDR